jgi:hypothetical protein
MPVRVGRRRAQLDLPITAAVTDARKHQTVLDAVARAPGSTSAQ